MADNLDLKNLINTPFAENGNKYEIPDKSSDESVDMDTGFGYRYATPPSKGGLYVTPELFNSIFYPIYAAVKELQDIAITAGFPINMQKAINTLNIENGGTGANNADDARTNLGLGTLATKDTITKDDINDNSITPAKITGVIPVDKGGTGLTTDNNWLNLHPLNTIIDTPMTLQEFCNKMSNNNAPNHPVKGAVYISAVTNTITDLPVNSGVLEYTFEENRRILQLYSPLSNGGIYYYQDNNQNNITGADMWKMVTNYPLESINTMYWNIFKQKLGITSSSSSPISIQLVVDKIVEKFNNVNINLVVFDLLSNEITEFINKSDTVYMMQIVFNNKNQGRFILYAPANYTTYHIAINQGIVAGIIPLYSNKGMVIGNSTFSLTNITAPGNYTTAQIIQIWKNTAYNPDIFITPMVWPANSIGVNITDLPHIGSIQFYHLQGNYVILELIQYTNGNRWVYVSSDGNGTGTWKQKTGL